MTARNDGESRSARREDHEWLPLDAVRDTFSWLVTGPKPVAVDGRDFPGLPDRWVPLDELRDLLLAEGCPGGTQDAVWAYLVRRARAEGDTWKVACAALTLPGLAASARRLAARYPGDRVDVHAAVLTGFLSALAEVDLRRPAISQRLRWAAHKAGHAALMEALDAPRPIASEDLDAAVEHADGPTPWAPGFRSTSPPRPWGHPDLVLARAVADGVLTLPEAELIGTTRLDEMDLADWARAHDVPYATANTVRWRAEQRLVAYLREDVRDTDPHDPILPAVATLIALSAQRTPPSEHAEQRTVSGRRRKRRRVREKKSTRTVKETGLNSGLLQCGDPAPTESDPTGPASTSEVPRCA